VPTPNPTPTPLPSFDLLPPERAESIFAEETAEDSLFESAPPPKVEMPDEPPGLEHTDLAIDLPEVANGPPAAPQPAPAPRESGGPWGKLDEPPVVAAPQPTDGGGERRRPPEPTPYPASQKLRVALIVVAVYAVLATAAAVWGWLRGGDRGNPLLFVPDFFGQYQRAQREKAVDLRPHLRAMGWDEKAIPPELRVNLGGRLAVGDLLVEPLAVTEARPTRITVFSTKDTPPLRQPLKGPCLLLTLRLTNTSKDLAFHPTDPAFDRKALPSFPPPLTAVVVGERQRFAGGPLVWPFGPSVKRDYLESQAADDEALQPGKARDYVVASPDRAEVIDAVRTAAGPVTWEVHLRRGVTRLQWDDISVGALLGVEFDPAAVKRLD
jgi:hypothetical protein